MATTRPSKLPANLKERIAALEQRNTVNSTSSPTSPATSPGLTDPNVAQSGKLKDRIAKFERKGGVPVPRGSFGLGAPPTGEVHKRGEFYGNRIQSSGKLTPHYTGGSIGSFGNSPPRRSFSASVLNGNFDDNSPPIASPSSFGSPGTPDFTGFSHEASPSPSANDIPAIKRHATGTSFHAALEFARKVEAAKREASRPPKKKKSTDSANTEKSIESSTTISVKPLNETVEPTPAILVSSDDLVAHESPSTVSKELPLQSNSVVEPSTSEVAEFQPPVDRPTKSNLSLTKSTTVADNPIMVGPVKGLSTPSNIENGTSKGASQIPVPAGTEVSEPTQISISQPPSLELNPGDKRELGRDCESNLRRSKSTPIRVTQIAAADAQSAPKFDPAESKLPDDRKDPSLVTEDVDTSTFSKNAIEPSASATKTVDELPPRTRSQIPARRVRPTIQPPEPSSFASSPPSGFHSATVSSAASLSSANSLPSITEMSPSEVSRALKMTPSTGRGIPVFLPPSNSHTTRKSDFVYLPSSPEDRPNFGVGHDVDESSIVSSGHPKAASEPDPMSNTFKTVVHGRVKETPASALPTKRQVIPRTPMKNTKRASILQNTLSPGHGELAALLQEAMLLEDTLNKGELPGESPIDETEDEPVKAEADANSNSLDAAKLKEEEERQQAAHAVNRSKRDMPTHGRLKHTFLMPLSRARASQKQETLTPVEQPTPRSSRDDPRPKSSIFDHVVDKDVVQEKSPSPSKIPKLPSFKRFGSISRTVSQQEALMRYSYSTSSEISSEDSNFIVTPPDNAVMEFGDRKPTKDADQQSSHSQTLSFSFPSLSPKRAASFAEKMWSRARTSSNGSIFSSASGVTPRSNEESSPQLQLPHIPSLSSFVPPVTEKDPILHRPASGSSLRNRVDTSGPLKAPSVPAPSPSHAQPKTPGDILLVPDISIPNQPLSAMSMSSFGSLPSPLFDKAICDAFPSVPTGTPAQLRNSYLFRGRGQSLNPANGASGDFDSALLSSAIHLAARNKAPASSDYTALTSAQSR